MTGEPTLDVLLLATVSVALVHTLIGVDHSLPFVMLARARGWTLTRTLAITAACGLGHVASSIVLGALGIGLGVMAERLEWIEGARGDLAAALLISFGLVYALRSLLRHARRQRHVHAHVHADGTVHAHEHHHEEEHRHAHDMQRTTTFWALFVIFALGPCEPLIPLLMAPAAMHDLLSTVLLAVVFTVVTLLSMLAVVTVGYLGMQRLRWSFFETHADTFAGLGIAASGLAIVAFGL